MDPKPVETVEVVLTPADQAQLVRLVADPPLLNDRMGRAVRHAREMTLKP